MNLLYKIYNIDLWKNKSGVWPNAWGWYRIIIPGQRAFYKPACTHDIAYTLWGNEIDKNRADINFYNDCMNNSPKSYHKTLAWIYFYAVKIFWLFCFNWK